MAIGRSEVDEDGRVWVRDLYPASRANADVALSAMSAIVQAAIEEHPGEEINIATNEPDLKAEKFTPAEDPAAIIQRIGGLGIKNVTIHPHSNLQ